MHVRDATNLMVPGLPFSVNPLSMWRGECINGAFRYTWHQPFIAAMTSLNYMGCGFYVSIESILDSSG